MTTNNIDVTKTLKTILIGAADPNQLKATKVVKFIIFTPGASVAPTRRRASVRAIRKTVAT